MRVRDTDVLVAFVGDEDRDALTVLLAGLDVVVVGLVVIAVAVSVDIYVVPVFGSFYLRFVYLPAIEARVRTLMQYFNERLF